MGSLVEDQLQVKQLLTEAITILCKDRLHSHFSSELSVEGLLGITLDRDSIFLVNINEKIQNSFGVKVDNTHGQNLHQSQNTAIKNELPEYNENTEQNEQTHFSFEKTSLVKDETPDSIDNIIDISDESKSPLPSDNPAFLTKSEKSDFSSIANSGSFVSSSSDSHAVTRENMIDYQDIDKTSFQIVPESKPQLHLSQTQLQHTFHEQNDRTESGNQRIQGTLLSTRPNLQHTNRYTNQSRKRNLAAKRKFTAIKKDFGASKFHSASRLSNLSLPQNSMNDDTAGMKVIRKESFVCLKCNKSFTSKQTFLSHEKFHHQGVSRFVCKVCGKGFQFKHGYEGHMAKHTGMKNHTCHVCQSGFAYASSLKVHIKRCHNIQDDFT